MKILLLSPLPPPSGGIATWSELFLNAEILKNHEIDVVNTAVIGKRKNNLLKRNFFDEFVRTFEIIIHTSEKLNSSVYDILHINTACSRFGMIREYICAIIAKNKKIKIVVHCHCDTKVMVGGKVAEYFFKKLCTSSCRIFCLNVNSYQHIKKITSIESVQIPNFIKEDDVAFDLKREMSREISNVIYVGHVTKLKGCDDIIAVAAQCPDITFRLVGYLSDEIRSMPVTPNVFFLGELSRKQVLIQMKKADILLFPSRTEGFPNVVSEAMLMGLPIIATPVGAVPEMVEDKGGILVEIGNVPQMIKALKRLDDKNLRDQMSKWNIAKVKASYTVEKVVPNILSQYKNIT